MGRSRFFVRCWAALIGLSVPATAFYALPGIWSQVVTTCIFSISGVLLVWLHRRGFGVEPLMHLSLLVGLVTFALATLGQTPADYTTLSLFIVIPLIAGFAFGKRVAAIWLVGTVLFSSAVIVAADHGWVMHYVDPHPTVSHVWNYGIGLVAAFFFARSFDGLRQETMDRMRALDRARAAFLANISHEIRTPMNGVLGMTEVMLLETLSASQRDQLGIIQRSGRTLVSLINDLLDVSKMEAGKLELERRPFNLDRVLSDVQGLLEPAAASKGLSLEVTKAKGIPVRFVGDGLRLGQVLTNLITNAIKFATTGVVRLEVQSVAGQERRCRFSVTDSGPGIEPEVLPRLFNAFEQGDSSTTRKYGGTGLGLALSQQLVNLMGGEIQVTSTLGKGSCFSFELHLDESDELSGEHPARRPPEPKAQAVLVVDDNPVNLKVALRLVELLGYQAEGAENGKLALEALQRRRFALVLMDCHMPEMDGFEATERIRAMQGDLARTPIVAVTASAMPDEVAACRRAGMNSVIAKPLTIEQLRDALAEPLN